MEALLNFISYNGNFHCRMEVSSVEWKFGICRFAMDGPYRLPYSFVSLSLWLMHSLPLYFQPTNRVRFGERDVRSVLRIAGL